MSILLQLNTSIFSADGQSSHLADEYVAGWRARHSKGRVIVRDFARDPVPHLTATRFQAFLTKPAERSAEQQAEVAFSDMLIDELKQADVIVMGLPMYNFGVPSMLKAYFDHIARAGVTFRYSDKGPEGLLTSKKVYVFATRGGLYVGTPRDTQTAYIREFLRLLGMTDIEFVYAEGLNISEAGKQAALAQAKDAIHRLYEFERVAA